MEKLSAIFENPDPKTRIDELVKLAKKLNVSTSKCKNDAGAIDENKLAILLFEEIRMGRQRKKQNFFLIIMATLLFIFGTVGMYIISKSLASMKKPGQGITVNEEDQAQDEEVEEY
jgi:hypothetical protein